MCVQGRAVAGVWAVDARTRIYNNYGGVHESRTPASPGRRVLTPAASDTCASTHPCLADTYLPDEPLYTVQSGFVEPPDVDPANYDGAAGVTR